MTQISPLDVNEYGSNGLPTGAKLVIGFTEVYYTLWRITTFASVEHCQYLQNLSIDFGKAQHKVAEMLEENGGYYGHDFEIDLDLRGESTSFFRVLAPKRYEAYQLAISRYAGRDMREIDPNEQYFSHYENSYDGYGRRGGVEAIYKKMSGLLWATYLNTEEKTIKGFRRRLIARECLVKAEILIKIGREYITPEQIKKREIKALKESAINGHHEENGMRVTVNVKKLGEPFSFDTQYGTTYIVTLIDDKGRLFKYMGSRLPDIGEDFIQVKATIKHDIYKDQPETKLQRIK